MSAPGAGPRISVIQDIDGADVGTGAFWGEVQSAVHKALGSLGVITDGSIRDIPQWADGFQALAGSIGPSHAWVHADNFGGGGACCRHDRALRGSHSRRSPRRYRHPAGYRGEAARGPPSCAAAAETPILEIARSADFSLARLKEALARSAEIH